jgi:hypothetical protein
MASELIYRRRGQLLDDPKWHPIGNTWGSLRATHPPVGSEALRGLLVRMPPGQRSPWHGSGGWPELGEPFPVPGGGGMFFATQGEIDFYAAGTSFFMKELDILLVNAIRYSYANPGSIDATFWTLHPQHARTDPAPAVASGTEIWTGDRQASQMRGSHPYYDAEPPHSDDELRRIALVPWDSYRRTAIKWHGGPGSYWGAHPFLRVGIHARMVRVPAQQTSETMQLSHDALFLGTGTNPALFTVEGEMHPLGANDALLVPGHTVLQFANPSSTEILFLEIRPGA